MSKSSQNKHKKSEPPAGVFFTMDMDDFGNADPNTVSRVSNMAAGTSSGMRKKQIDIAFVNLNEETGPMQDMDTRHQVRAHVMRDFQRKKHREILSKSSIRALLPIGENAGDTGVNGIVLAGPGSQIMSEPMPSLEHSGMWSSGASSSSILGHLTAVDPFNVMPIPGNPMLQSLIHYYNNVLVNTMIPVNPKDKWFNHAISDPALFHGTMMHAASHRSLMSANHDSLVALQLKRETIRIINERLADPVQSISDTSIGAVTVLVLLENQEGNVELSNIHMEGLERMIDLRGGLKHLGLSGVLRRKVLWADLCNANLSGRVPRFEFVPENDDMFPACVRIDEINRRFSTFKLTRPVNSPKICACSEQFREIILDLRSISESHLLTSNVTGELSDRIYLADQRLYMLSRGAINSPEEHSPDCSALGPSCFIAGSIYIYSLLRDFPLAVPIFGKFLERLTPFLLNKNDLVERWGSKYQLLIWVLTLSALASIQRVWRFGLVVQLAKVCVHNGVGSYEQFVEQLKGVVWRNAEEDENLVQLWTEAEYARNFNVNAGMEVDVSW